MPTYPSVCVCAQDLDVACAVYLPFRYTAAPSLDYILIVTDLMVERIRSRIYTYTYIYILHTRKMYIGIIYFVKWSRTVRATVVAIIILNESS